MNKPLIFTTALMATVLIAGAAVEADSLYEKVFPPTRLIEYHKVVKPGDTLWDICSDIATDKEDLRKLVWQAKRDNGIKDAGKLQPGTLIIVRVKEARQ